MPADLTGLQAQIDALAAQAEQTVGVEASAKVVIDGFATAIQKAVADAITADDAIDNSAISTVSAAIEATRQKFADSAASLGASIPA